MKKFLLLLVGVLFALSAKADWTFYVDISGTGWTEAPYFYAGHGEQFYEARQCETTPVKDKIYKVTFKGWSDLTELYICKSKLVDTQCSKAKIEEAGTENVDWFGKFSTTAYSQPEYGFDSDNSKTPLFKLTKGSNGASITVNYDPNATDPGESTVVYKYSGDETGWNGNSGADELALTYNKGDGTYSLTRTFANNKNFGIREYTNGKQTAWYYGVKGSNTISTVGQPYNAVKSDGSNWNFQLTAGEYTLTFNPTAKTIVFTSTATPTVETAYTIYFDTLQSGWRKVALFNDGVEVVGSLEKRGYIHGANEDGVEGYLHKYIVNTTDAKKLTFINGTNSYPLETITDGNVYYVSGSELAGAALGDYKVNADPSYRLHGSIVSGSWETWPMIYRDGLWIYEANDFKSGGFGIKKVGPNDDISGSNPWIHAQSKDATAVTLGVTTQGKVKSNGDGGADFSSSVTDKSTLVFDPEANTVMFINPAAVSASVAAEATTINGAKANNLNVAITVADYYKGTGATSYTLSNGSYSVTSDDGNFTNVPYATNYTLKPDNGSAMPINITLPTIPFVISAQNSTLVAPAPDSGITRASLVVYFKANCDWWYNLPQIVCTCGGEPISGTVVWKSDEVGTEYEYDFAFIANEVVAYDSYAMKATEDKTFKFVITPVYPFAVEAPAATPAPSMMRAAANSFQYVTGAAVPGNDVEVAQTSGVSGVEGVMIEGEEAPVEYFNLQGQRVNGELAPGIYIRRQGSSVTKVRF